MKKNQIVLAAALMASMAGVTAYAAPAESLQVVDKSTGQITANVTDQNFAVKYGENRVNIDSTGITIEGALKVDGQNVNLSDVAKAGQAASDAAAAKNQAEQNKNDIANLTYHTGTKLEEMKTDLGDVAAKAEQNKKDIANLTYHTGTQLGEMKTDIADVDAKAEQNKKDIANLTYHTGTQLGEMKTDIADVDAKAEQNKKDIAANKQTLSDLTQNTKENFESVNKQLAGQSKVNGDQDKAIAANKDAIKANSDKLNQQGEILKEHNAQLEYLSNEVYDNQVANDKKNAEQDKIIDTNKWKADTALKLTGNGALQNGATDLTTGVNLNTQAIEKEQKAREDADTAIRNDFAKADEKTLSDAKAYTDSASKELGSRIDSIDKSNKKGVAKAAALAALHPQDYDPNAKWDFAAGFGNYGGENATALGAFYRPNRNVMISLGGTLGGDDNAVNVGLSFKLGHAGQKVEESSETTAKLYDMIGELQKKLDAQQQKIEALEAKEAK